MDTLGERLEFIRTKKKMKQNKVMEICEISDLGRYEKNERQPSLKSFLTLANFYGVNTEWLLTGTGEIWKNDKKEAEELTVENAIESLGITSAESKQRAIEYIKLLKLKEMMDRNAELSDDLKSKE